VVAELYCVRLVRMTTDVENQIVSVERVLQYAELVTEAPPVILSTMPSPDWPQEGAIECVDLKIRYRFVSLSGSDLEISFFAYLYIRDGLPMVLRGISCAFKPKEKIGVVGRTGAGKR